MQSAAFDRADLGWSDGDKVLEAVRKIATEDLSPVANKIDQEGFYPSESIITAVFIMCRRPFRHFGGI